MVQFKSIKLVGFKSFADKTEIPLSEGVTCIVGPNGCGKSNVADAIRWVLGEQSAKMMRGSQMLDVIFGGTEKRKKMSFCEVTLTFDNTNRLFDIDSDEVEMTRRLYRDGESEYILNRQPSRMKILTGLLHGAGAAKEGYSIIGQGRIAQIMNSRPEERRSIFEEATGIVVFKERKAEVERKLASTRDNLFIFAQRMQEVERQLGPLSKAAENAKKYEELYKNLRLHEINLYICRYDGAAGERDKINSKLAKFNAQLATLNERSNALLKEYEECRSLRESADARLNALYDQRVSYTAGLERSSGESRLFQERAKAVKSNLEKARDEWTYTLKRSGEIDKEIRRLEDYGRKTAERLERLRAQSELVRVEIGTLNESIASYEYMTGEHRKKVMDTFKDLSEMKENIGSLSAKKELLRDRLSEMTQEMSGIKEEHAALKREYGKAVDAQQALHKFLGEENELLEKADFAAKAAEEKLQSLIKREYDVQAQITSLNSSLNTYTALRDRFEGYVYSVKRLLNDAKVNSELNSRILGLIADVIDCPKEYEIAIETAFGGAMQNVITETREDAQFLISYLKNNRAGQVTFLPIEALRPRYENQQIASAAREKGALGYAVELVNYDKKYENVIHNLLGNTLICDDIQSATRIAGRYPRAFKIVTLDGDVIATSGSMTGGSRRENSANLLANERKIKEIEDELELKKSQLKRTMEKHTEALEERKKVFAEKDALEEKFQNARLELAAASEKQNSLMLNVNGKESEYAAYMQSIKALEDKLKELDSEYSSKSMGASTLSEQSVKASSEIDDMSAKYEKSLAERNDKLEKLNNYQVNAASLETAAKSNAENVERLNNEKREMVSRLASLEASLPALQKELDDFNEKATRAALTEEEQKVLDGIVSKIDELQQSKKQIAERENEIDAERLDNYKASEEIKEKIHAQELALQKIDSDLEFLQQRINEEYHEDYEGCLKYKVENYEVSTANANITNYKRQLTALGPVNPNAIAEFEEVSERYSKMTSDKEDIEKAMSDLEVALEDIKSEMLRIFNDGFNTINENFKRTFKELFGGGNAQLELDYTDCADPLDAGVEIIACPPGKKLTKISLLSGGEQALTAIAILFAIIQMRPMPFCVLDEIEAALDEANVARYAKYLKKFAAQTQFIVITHRKPTMENADILFGVTMEEKGVSKIVSVKLSEVEQRLGGDTLE